MSGKIELNSEHYWNEARKARFAAKVKIDAKTGCWEWTGSLLQGKGYGQFYWGREGDEMKSMAAHRAAWLLFVGAIPEDKQVLHKCNNRKCVRPDADHVYLGDHAQNMRDRDAAGHTSRGAHRYNYRRTQELISKVSKLREDGALIQDICEKLNIGRTTYYRISAGGFIDAVKNREIARVNYRRAALRR